MTPQISLQPQTPASPAAPIRGWRITLYFASRNPVVLFFTALVIIGLGVALAWETRGLHIDESKQTLVEELAKERPDPLKVYALLLRPPSVEEKDNEKPLSLLDMERLIRGSRLRGDQAAVAIALLNSLTLPMPAPGAELLMAAHSPAPPAHANRLVGELLLSDLKFDKAIDYLAREVRHHASVQAADSAARAALDSASKDLIRVVHGNPEIALLASRLNRLLMAAELGLWGESWCLILEEEWYGIKATPMVLSGLAALVWGIILMQSGQVRSVGTWRFLLMALGFVGGICSTLPTLLVSLVQDQVQGLRMDGSLLDGLRFFLEGVGLREEALKLAFFLPLLPSVLRRRQPLEMLFVPAAVGLGFASWENIRYFADYDASVAFPRFLTANFLHLSLTGLLGFALCGVFRHGFLGILRFVFVFAAVVLAHGLYDAFIIMPQFAPMQSLSLFILCFIGLLFLRQTRIYRDLVTDQLCIAATFTLGLSLLCSTAFVLATHRIGFFEAVGAFLFSMLGLLFLAVSIYWQLGEGMTAREDE